MPHAKTQRSKEKLFEQRSFSLFFAVFAPLREALLLFKTNP
jgi:hypothetical protein